jgi:glucose-1-phosphate thymidylyltransferase
MLEAVVLAAGRGTRMRAPDDAARLEPAQRAAADAGLKALIPFAGEPFLSYVLGTLADSGIRDVCLVVGPGDDPVRREYEARPTRRLRLRFAVQHTARGSADALSAAEQAVAGDDFILINGDNLYTPDAIHALLALPGPGLVGFRRDGLLRGNITADRLAAFALVLAGCDGMLRDIVEKPQPAELAAHAATALFSMTCWRFDRRIFDACRAIGVSPRGELELPDAVRHATTTMNQRFRVVPLSAPVLDLSSRRDVAAVAGLVAGQVVAL